ncbi:MAG: DNA polymerase I [Verrucomicrobiales bacterium]|nr:DNA polymerase I [Verrucomicrobiales bacterium]
MSDRLFLLDGMALLYRAHFAFVRSPIFTSDGVNTSALYGFTNTLLDILKNRQPTHLAVALDTSAPTPRHEIFPAYKAQREEMPEDIAASIPRLHRLLAALRIPLLTHDGLEADDIIGILARQADAAGLETFMVTPDKDFGQLVTPQVKILKPGRQGAEAEILGVEEINAKWGIQSPAQLIDVLALMGDAVDNVPGIPGFGEKTAIKLIQQFGSVENLIANQHQLKGKQKERVAEFGDQALLSKRLVTIFTDVPLDARVENLRLQEMDEPAVRAFFTEFEFNALGRRLFGEDFKAGRSRQASSERADTPSKSPASDLFEGQNTTAVHLHSIADTPHEYQLIHTAEQRTKLCQQLAEASAFCFDLETTSLDPRDTAIVGIAFSWQAHQGVFVHFPRDPEKAAAVLEEFRPILQHPGIEKIGHNLKFDLSVLLAHGLEAVGPFFDTMLAHSLVEPEQRHGMDFLSETYLSYSPVSITTLISKEKDLFGQQTMADVAEEAPEKVKDYAAEDADVTWQLADKLRHLLVRRGVDRIFEEIESPLLPVLTRMENQGVQVNVHALQELSQDFQLQADALQRCIQDAAGTPFNLNSPKQLGEVLFDHLKLLDKPKKTATGQYQTNEAVLQSLTGLHPIIEDILSYREITKLKGTYLDALPQAVSPVTGRIHTQLHQLIAATGRMASSNPNLQNIPVRTANGRQIRKAFVPSEPGWVLLSADYSQIELRVMAALSGDPAMIEAFAQGQDIHQATAARVYDVALDDVTADMRRTAKMVNFGIIYGISAFGLAQRLGIPRSQASEIIDAYFKQFSGIQRYIDEVITTTRSKGYVETLSGRRRYIRDLDSANATIRGAAERVAVNTPIQGTAADMIKLAMIRVDEDLRAGGMQTRMLLQVHDELLFEAPEHEVPTARLLIIEAMRHALPLPHGVPAEVECGTGSNWLEAH